MSEYFRVLKRLQAEQGDPVTHRPPPVARIEPPPALIRDPSVRREPWVVPNAPRLASPLVSPAYATLYDNLRAKANGRPTRALVFAGAAATDPVRPITDGMAAHVRRLALRVIVAELCESQGRPLLRARPEACDMLPHELESMPLDLRSHAGGAGIKSWLGDSAGAADLVIIEGSALIDSIDSALLGCACDGLVLVAQTEVTPRDALSVAVERAHAVGCRPLGLVMYGTKDRLPAWARQFFHQYRRPLTASEVR